MAFSDILAHVAAEPLIVHRADPSTRNYPRKHGH